MKIKVFYLLIFYLTLLCSSAKCQLQDHIWWFGPSNLGIKFSNAGNIPSVISGKYTPFSSEGCSVVADPTTGKLKFYTDGLKIIDSTHRVMPNGGGLIGDISTAQSGLSIGIPGQCNQYYVFSNNSSLSYGEVSYSIVDMTLPGNGTVLKPLGDVVAGKKSISIATDAGESMTIIPGSLPGKYYLLHTVYSSSNIKIYDITSAGVTFKSIFNTGHVLSDQRNMKYCKVNNKISLTSLDESNPIVIVDFNPSTGTLSNAVTVTGSPFGTSPNYMGFYDSEWSPDGSKLYLSKHRDVGSGGKIYQYDLNNPGNVPYLVYSASVNSNSYNGRGLRLGPDGKIYWLYLNDTYNDTRLIGVVNNPNTAGVSCNFNNAGFNVGQDQGLADKFPEYVFPQSSSQISIPDTRHTCVKGPIVISAGGVGSNTSLYGNTIGNSQIQSDQSLLYSPAPNFSGVDSIKFVVTSTGCSNYTDSVLAIIEVNTLPVSIPNLFTPNSDLLNDRLEIKAGCANVDIEIYNRWGALIYKKQNYKGDWDGKDCPDGLYYYHILLDNLEYKGWIQILR